MMKTPTDFEIDQLMHVYDAEKAHEYYVRTRKLKGRQPGQQVPPQTKSPKGPPPKNSKDPRAGKTKVEISKNAKAKQKKELAAAIHGLEQRLHKLEAVIKERVHKEASANRKGKAKKERAAKEHDKPKTAAEKAKAERENKKFREKHKQELRTKAKKEAHKSGGASPKSDGSAAKYSVSHLQGLAKKVRGQIAVAKQKLAAL